MAVNFRKLADQVGAADQADATVTVPASCMRALLSFAAELLAALVSRGGTPPEDKPEEEQETAPAPAAAARLAREARPAAQGGTKGTAQP